MTPAAFTTGPLGAIENGGEPGEEKPYQLRSASSTGPRGGRLDAEYDDAGNLTSLNLVRKRTVPWRTQL